MILVVDDLRCFNPDLDIFYARTLEAAMSVINGLGPEDELWLDHDLGPDEDIRPLVDLLDERVFLYRKLELSCIRIISANPVGREYIVRALGRHYTILPCEEKAIGT